MHMEIFTYRGEPVRVGSYEGEPWFVGADVAAILGFENPKGAVQEFVEAEERVPMMMHCDEHDHDYRVDLISYFGIHSLFFHSDKTEMDNVDRMLFKSWLADVATVVRHGGFEEE